MESASALGAQGTSADRNGRRWRSEAAHRAGWWQGATGVRACEMVAKLRLGLLFGLAVHNTTSDRSHLAVGLIAALDTLRQFVLADLHQKGRCLRVRVQPLFFAQLR